MDTPTAAVNAVTSIWEQLTNAPSHLLLLVVLIFFGMLIKKSPTPNWVIPWALILLGAVGYPMLASPTHINPSFPNPSLVLGIYGGLLGVGAMLAHGLLKKLAWFQRIELAFVNSFRDEDQKETGLEQEKKT